MTVTNEQFLTALFAEDAPFAHITDFDYDPGNIPSDKHLIAWKGDYASRYMLRANTNQYFTISVFQPDEKQVARRRKALFLRTRVIVLDDVREKLNIEEVNKLPEPAYILETSAGSEQWGYILDTPCTERHMVENLLDGLVANGLAPAGKDPGMKGVTRYVRLPEGVNTKSNKLVDGQPFACRILSWNPDRRVGIESLARPFSVDLQAVRREGRVDGAADLPDHPLMQIPDLIRIKDIRSDGRFDITCPWVDEHTGSVDNGSAVFTNNDGSVGFKCHHGACEQRTVKDLMRFLDKEKPGFSGTLSMYRMKKEFEGVVAPVVTSTATPVVATPSFMEPVKTQSNVEPAEYGPREVMNELRMIDRNSHEAKTKAVVFLQAVDSLPALDRITWHDEIRDVMHWSKTFMKEMLKELRADWYESNKQNLTIYDSIMYVREQDKFYDTKTRIFYTPAAFQNSFSHDDVEARKTALEQGMVKKVDKLNFAPKRPAIYQDGHVTYGNTWSPVNMNIGVPGDVTRWLDHWDKLGWEGSRDHMLKWMAYTLLYPERKINHMLLLCSREGCGKDFLLYPLIKAMNEYCQIIEGSELLSDHNEYLLSCKYLHINEAELSDHRDAKLISNKLKPMTSTPPDSLRVNPKGVTALRIDNIVNCTMTANGGVPLKLSGTSRRIYALWTDLNVRDEQQEMTDEWRTYWEEQWNWMYGGGVENCIHYLMTQVDLIGFNPGAAPRMTEFLREIVDASKSPALQTIEALITARIGPFASDMLSATDICAFIKTAALVPGAEEFIMHDPAWFTPVRVGQVMRDVQGAVNLKAARGRDHVRVWTIRNSDRYKVMTVGQLYNAYKEMVMKK